MPAPSARGLPQAYLQIAHVQDWRARQDSNLQPSA